MAFEKKPASYNGVAYTLNEQNQKTVVGAVLLWNVDNPTPQDADIRGYLFVDGKKIRISICKGNA